MERSSDVINPGLLSVAGVRNYNVVQKPDGPHLVVKVSVEELKQMIMNSIDPKYKAFTTIDIGPAGITVDVKL